MNKLLLVLIFYLISLSGYAQTIFINEFHYDNTGSDTIEFVEVVVPVAVTDIANIKVSLYNGNDGTKYAGETSLSSFTLGSTANGHHYYYKDYSSIQNGSPDGIFIKYYTTGDYLFLSYEGIFTATNGPATGLTSTDIGVAESGSTQVNSSLYLSGNGSQYTDFTWAVSSGTNTKGAANNGQNLLPITISSFIAKTLGDGVQLQWSTSSEENNDYFSIERSQDGVHFDEIGQINGAGSSKTVNHYQFMDKLPFSSISYYRLKQVDLNGDFSYSHIVVSIPISTATDLKAFSNAAHELELHWQASGQNKLQLYIYDLSGRIMYKRPIEEHPGENSYSLFMSGISSGLYIIQLEDPAGKQMIKWLK